MFVLQPSASGITVLVETFGGRRNYYIYVSADAPVEDMKRRLFSTRYIYLFYGLRLVINRQLHLFVERKALLTLIATLTISGLRPVAI